MLQDKSLLFFLTSNWLRTSRVDSGIKQNRPRNLRFFKTQTAVVVVYLMNKLVQENDRRVLLHGENRYVNFQQLHNSETKMISQGIIKQEKKTYDGKRGGRSIYVPPEGAALGEYPRGIDQL